MLLAENLNDIGTLYYYITANPPGREQYSEALNIYNKAAEERDSFYLW